MKDSAAEPAERTVSATTQEGLDQQPGKGEMRAELKGAEYSPAMLRYLEVLRRLERPKEES